MKSTTSLTLTLIIIGTVALAHGGATGIVKERMDQMGDVSKSMKTMVAMIKGEAPYDAVQVRDLAAGIAARSGDHLTELFPEGSLDKPTEALPEIWTDWPRFAEQAEDMRRAALALADGAATDDARVLIGELAGTCKSCHDDYRLKK